MNSMPAATTEVEPANRPTVTLPIASAVLAKMLNIARVVQASISLVVRCWPESVPLPEVGPAA